MRRQGNMYVRKRVGRRRSFIRKFRLPIFVLACTAVFLVASFLTRPVKAPIFISPNNLPPIEGIPNADDRIQVAQSERVIYPYSVIPGGVRSRTELVQHILNDPVVSSHYADFNIEKARFIRAEESQFVHVAYRLRDKIFWTAKAVEIPKGETLISDGNSVARTRCGNKVSVLPQEPISDEEPPIDSFEIPTLETPMIASLEPPRLDFMREPESELPVQPVASQIPYVPITVPVFDHLRYSTLRPLALLPRFSEIPEAGTLVLAASGLLALFAFRFTRKK